MRERVFSRVTRRHLQVALGLVWLLDGALQLQPYMFGKGFANQIIAPTGAGQPAIVSAPVHWAAHLTLAHPVVFNAIYAGVQLAIGLGLLLKRTTRVALAGSIVWGVGVWWLGEGLGGLTAGPTLLNGAPGAALLYAVLAVLVWPTGAARSGAAAEAPSTGFAAAPSWLAVPAWSALWLGMAALQMTSGNSSQAGLHSTFAGASQELTGWIGRVDGHLATTHLGVGFPSALVAVEVLIALFAVVPGATRRISGGLGALLALASWVLVQGLGELTSGQATDPGAGPLIVLLAIALVACTPRPTQVRVSSPALAPA